MKKIILALSMTAFVTGCATTSGITPQYVNPANYQSYDCQSLAQEVQRVSNLADATEKQNIKLSTGIGFGIAAGRGGLYPSIGLGTGFGGGARNAKKTALAKLYGEHDAMIITARKKGCQFAQGIKIYNETIKS